uniref:Uncharacterized protein n=1 Tax=Oryza nivara TaxID=4536 RepID=A0A0E0HM61_ORYNI
MVACREKLVGQLRGVGSEEVHRLWELVEDLVGSVAHEKRILSAAAHAGRTSLAPALLGGEAHRGLRTRGEARRRSHIRDGLGWLHARFQSFLTPLPPLPLSSVPISFPLTPFSPHALPPSLLPPGRSLQRCHLHCRRRPTCPLHCRRAGKASRCHCL